MIFSTTQIRFLLHELSYETVVEPSDKFGFRIQKRTGGYREGVGGQVQAALSIMLEAKERMG